MKRTTIVAAVMFGDCGSQVLPAPSPGPSMISPRSVLALLLLMAVAAPLTAQNPWTRVPAFPTTCYTSGDPFPEQLEAAMAANQDAIGRQEQINHGLNDQLKSMDRSAMQSKMMAYMQKNPAGFQAYMQAAAQDPQVAQAAKEAHLARMKGFQQEFDGILANYNAALKTTLDPVFADMLRVTDAASNASNAERAAAVSKYNSTYNALCLKWIVREDFPAFLTKFKGYMVGIYLPSLDGQTAMEKTALEMAGINTSEYQPTDAMQAVARHMEYVRAAFGLRQAKPLGPS